MRSLRRKIATGGFALGIGFGGAAATSLIAPSEALAGARSRALVRASMGIPDKPKPREPQPREQKFSSEEEAQIRAVSESIYTSLQVTPDGLATWANQRHPDGTDNRLKLSDDSDWWGFPGIKATQGLTQYGTTFYPDGEPGPLTPEQIERGIALALDRGLSREEAQRRIDQSIADRAANRGKNVYELLSGTYRLPRQPHLFVDYWNQPEAEIETLGINNGQVTHSLSKEPGGQSSVLFATSILPDGTKLVYGGTYNFDTPHNPLIGDRQQNFTTNPVFGTTETRNNLDGSLGFSIPFPNVDRLNAEIQKNTGVPLSIYFDPYQDGLAQFSLDGTFLGRAGNGSIDGVNTFPPVAYRTWKKVLFAFLQQDVDRLQEVVADNAQNGGPFIPTIKHIEKGGETIATPVTQDDVEHSVRTMLSSQTRLGNMFNQAPLTYLRFLRDGQSLLDN